MFFRLLYVCNIPGSVIVRRFARVHWWIFAIKISMAAVVLRNPDHLLTTRYSSSLRHPGDHNTGFYWMSQNPQDNLLSSVMSRECHRVGVWETCPWTARRNYQPQIPMFRGWRICWCLTKEVVKRPGQVWELRNQILQKTTTSRKALGGRTLWGGRRSPK